MAIDMKYARFWGRTWLYGLRPGYLSGYGWIPTIKSERGVKPMWLRWFVREYMANRLIIASDTSMSYVTENALLQFEEPTLLMFERQLYSIYRGSSSIEGSILIGYCRDELARWLSECPELCRFGYRYRPTSPAPEPELTQEEIEHLEAPSFSSTPEQDELVRQGIQTLNSLMERDLNTVTESHPGYDSGFSETIVRDAITRAPIGISIGSNTVQQLQQIYKDKETTTIPCPMVTQNGQVLQHSHKLIIHTRTYRPQAIYTQNTMAKPQYINL